MFDPRDDSPDAFDRLLHDELRQSVAAPTRLTASVMGRVGYMRVAEGERRRRRRRQRLVRAGAAAFLLAAMATTGVLLHTTDRVRDAHDGFTVDAAVTRDVDTARQAFGRTVSSIRQLRSLIPAADAEAGADAPQGAPQIGADGPDASDDTAVLLAAESAGPMATDADAATTSSPAATPPSDPRTTYAGIDGRPMPVAGVGSFPGTRAADPFAPQPASGVGPLSLPVESAIPGLDALIPRGPHATWTLPEAVDRSAIGPVAWRGSRSDRWSA